MAFTNGSLYGRLEGNTTGSNTNSAFNSCNSTNPNLKPAKDLFQILGVGGSVLLRVDATGAVTTNVAAGVATSDTTVATVQMTAAQFNGLASKTGSTAAQICAAAFPINYNGQQLDLFQVGTEIASPTVSGGGGVIYRLKYDGSTATS